MAVSGKIALVLTAVGALGLLAALVPGLVSGLALLSLELCRTLLSTQFWSELRREWWAAVSLLALALGGLVWLSRRSWKRSGVGTGWPCVGTSAMEMCISIRGGLGFGCG